MKKQEIKPFDLWRETMDTMGRHGLLLCTVNSDGKPNVMNVAWLTGGLIWGRPIITMLIRTNRHSFKNLEQTHHFTVNALPPEFADALQYLGSASGATEDKFAKTNLTLAPARVVASPIIAEGVMHFECRVVHKNDVIPGNLIPEIASLGAGHRVYFGEIVAASAAPDTARRLSQPYARSKSARSMIT